MGSRTGLDWVTKGLSTHSLLLPWTRWATCCNDSPNRLRRLGLSSLQPSPRPHRPPPPLGAARWATPTGVTHPFCSPSMGNAGCMLQQGGGKVIWLCPERREKCGHDENKNLHQPAPRSPPVPARRWGWLEEISTWIPYKFPTMHIQNWTLLGSQTGSDFLFPSQGWCDHSPIQFPEPEAPTLFPHPTLTSVYVLVCFLDFSPAPDLFQQFNNRFLCEQSIPPRFFSKMCSLLLLLSVIMGPCRRKPTLSCLTPHQPALQLEKTSLKLPFLSTCSQDAPNTATCSLSATYPIKAQLKDHIPREPLRSSPDGVESHLHVDYSWSFTEWTQPCGPVKHSVLHLQYK